MTASPHICFCYLHVAIANSGDARLLSEHHHDEAVSIVAGLVQLPPATPLHADFAGHENMFSPGDEAPNR